MKMLARLNSPVADFFWLARIFLALAFIGTGANVQATPSREGQPTTEYATCRFSATLEQPSTMVHVVDGVRVRPVREDLRIISEPFEYRAAERTLHSLRRDFASFAIRYEDLASATMRGETTDCVVHATREDADNEVEKFWEYGDSRRDREKVECLEFAVCRRRLQVKW